MRIRILSRVAWLWVLLLLATSAAAERQTIVILHTNDTHAAYRARPASWRDDHPLVGGTLALDAAVRAERTRWQRVLLLDAGDVLTGSPLSEISVDGARGGGLYELMNRVGYDAMTIGNHDFDQGADNVDALVALAKFPVLSANLTRPDGRPYADAPGKVFDLDGVSVGVVGLVTEHLDGLLPKKIRAHTEVTSAAEAARKWIDSLPTRPDVLVALTHEGVDEDEDLARAVPDLDLIVGGHSHTRLTEPKVVGTTKIVQAGSRMQNLGRVRIEVEDGKIVSLDGSLIDLYATGVRERKDLAQLVDGYEKQIDAEYGEVLGQAARALRRKGSATNIGIWLSETLADGTDSDFGVMNNGGIRADISAGPITKLDIYRVLPFHNYVTTFEVTGQQLLDFLKSQAEMTADHGRGSMQIGYLTARWKRVGDDVVLVDPTCRGKPIDPAGHYRGVGADFVVVSQAGKYLRCEPSDVHVGSELLSTYIEDRLRQAKTVDVQRDDRMDEVK